MLSQMTSAGGAYAWSAREDDERRADGGLAVLGGDGPRVAHAVALHHMNVAQVDGVPDSRRHAQLWLVGTSAERWLALAFEWRLFLDRSL